MEMIPRGAAGDANYRSRDAANRDHQLTVVRAEANASVLASTERSATSVARELPDGIGYIDLDRANKATLDSALQKFNATRALILDARGMGRGSANQTATLAAFVQRVSTQLSAVVGKQTVRLASAPCFSVAPMQSSCAQERRQFDDVISVESLSRYKGRTVLLIDERTQGAFEQFGLALESVAGTTFIGSPSAGASGALTAVSLPGQLTATFSGSEIRHADGRQLQRVGLTPQVDVRPTVKGIRAGTDEVLDRAQLWLKELLDPPARKRK